jgi:hippurate hydrolase
MSGSATADIDLQALQSLRHRLHREPETGFEVSATASILAEHLRAAGLTVTTGVGGSGVVATLRRGQSEAAIGLRADMDALPITEHDDRAHRSTVEGKFHGCGHDGHATMLLGAARALMGDDRFEGTVHFIFQPDEENGRGAQAMIDDGLFERFPMDAIFGLHNLPGMPVGAFATRTGPFTAFEERFTIDIAGRGGHASSPQHAVDPLVPGAGIVLALQTIVARSLAPGDFGVVSATEFTTDGAPNILPGHVTIRGDTRGYDDAVSATIERRMRALVEGIAAAHGAHATLHYAREFEPTVNTAAEVRDAAGAARGIAGATVDDDHAAMGFSEDFARFLGHRPGCFMLLGNGTEGPHARALHNPGYDFNDAVLPWGIEYWTRLVHARLAP